MSIPRGEGAAKAWYCPLVLLWKSQCTRHVCLKFVMSDSFNVWGPLANESIPLKHVLCWGGGRSQGGDVALNSLLRTCISLKHPLSCRALHQAGRVYGQVESVFLMDLSLEKPAGLVFINPAGFRFWDIVCGHPRGGILPIIAYMGRLCPKAVPFPGFRNMKE